MKVIGISSSNQKAKDFTLTRVSGDNLTRVREKGGLPIIIPSLKDPGLAKDYIDKIDSLILTGGADVAPFNYGKNPNTHTDYDFERDAFELALFVEAMKREMPIMAICRGLQLVNVALGGTLILDLKKAGYEDIIHVREDMDGSQWKDAFHTIRVSKDSRLYQNLGQDELIVNSIHHQAIDELGDGLVSVAESDDGIIEIVEMKDYENFIGFQFHPERMGSTSLADHYYSELVRRA